MGMLLNIFKSEDCWKKFLKSFREGKVESTVADENIWPFLLSAFFTEIGLPLLIITSTRERAEQLEKEIRTLLPGVEISVFPGLGNNIFYKNRPPDQQGLAGRLKTLRILLHNYFMPEHCAISPMIIIATASSLINLCPFGKILDLKSFEISRGKEYDRDSVASWLAGHGYQRVNRVFDRGEFSLRGDILDVFDIISERPVRIDFMIDEVEKIMTIDPVEGNILGTEEKTFISPDSNPWEIARNSTESRDSKVPGNRDDKLESFPEALKNFWGDFGTVLCDPLEVSLKIKSELDILDRVLERETPNLVSGDPVFLSRYLLGRDFIDSYNYHIKLNIVSISKQEPGQKEFFFSEISGQKQGMGNPGVFIRNIKSDFSKRRTVIISLNGTDREEKLKKIFLDNSISFKYLDPEGKPCIEDTYEEDNRGLGSGIAYIFPERLYSGFSSGNFSVYGEMDIYGQMEVLLPGDRILPSRDRSYFNPGEFVVHKNHGIGKYMGIISRQVGDIKREYFLLEYAGNDRLYIPAWQADRITGYIGSKNPMITALDSRHWDRLKKKARDSVKKLAVDLAGLYAVRQSVKGYAFPPDSPWQREIEELFPFKETPDQVKAINAVKEAMECPVPMDLLVIGDVGFGKTEVAIRAAFKAMEEGKQVLMLVPTTILADQHYMTFSKRYKDYPVNIEVLSRFRKRKNQKDIIRDFNAGRIDMLIGTHRILQKDIIPLNLGLIIVDEEQRFGVNSKEKIKVLKAEVDVLTLSATPIPRTLYMSLSGIKDIAKIETHPEGRNPIETFVGETDFGVTRSAVEREIARGGQVYYVYNRVAGIEEKKSQLQMLLPYARIALTHGQMDGQRIEKVMSDFIDRKYDILLTTSIIESGMDIENVNTLIVENSHMFGLSQLYQLRGRVGRSSGKAYAYFFYPGRRNLSLAAFQRLKTLTEYTDLGSGYEIAMKDLEIRGAGELLGPRQHGHINSIGFDMYCQIIREEVDRINGKKVEEDINIQIDLPLSAYIPKSYIRNEDGRINVYRKLGSPGSFDDIDILIKEIQERHGNIPKIVENLAGIAKIKYLLRKGGIERLAYKKGSGIVLKKIELPAEKIKSLEREYGNVEYQPRFGQLTLKYLANEKDIDPGLILSVL
ncbi:MAG: transcription-repair coupling factor, partial [Actinobacteria bacterium]|nr:transcription-repair coupling factor [Actinomycetota bacterium]